MLIAKVPKVAYFEVVLGSVARSRTGHCLPLVAYVADEAHRFVRDIGDQTALSTTAAFLPRQRRAIHRRQD